MAGDLQSNFQISSSLIRFQLETEMAVRGCWRFAKELFWRVQNIVVVVVVSAYR